MRRACVAVVLLLLAGCATSRTRSSLDAIWIFWPEYTPFAMGLIESLDDAPVPSRNREVKLPEPFALPERPRAPAPVAPPPASAPAPVQAPPPPPARIATEYATLGEKVTFEVTADGTPPLDFQWRKDGLWMLGETGRTLTIGAAKSTDAGIYDCLASNPAGVKASQPIRLVVRPP